MKLMNRLAWRSLWKNRTRTAVTIIGILLSAAMFTAVTTLGVSLLQYLVEITVYNTGDYFIRFDDVTPEQVEVIENREEISQLGMTKTLGYANVGTEERNQSYILSALDENAFAMRSIHLVEGRLPESADEIVVPEHSLWYLRAMGMKGELDEHLTLDVVPRYEDAHYYEHMPEFPIEDIPNFTRSYVIVGIVENESSRLSDWSMEPMNFITVDDGSYPGFHWARVFAKTADPMDAYALEDASLATVCSVNTELLNYYGASKYTNINEMIFTVCAVLMVIILAGSVSLIYNAFSISLAERSKDFGLLSSVGATKKQLRKSVYFEALALSAIGVPLGILFGFGGIAVTLHLTGDLVTGLLTGSVQSGVVFRAIPSLPAFGCAGAVAVLTVLISARLPLRRAMKQDPIRAIRQQGDYQIPKKVRGGTLARKLFGVPGLMSAKYYSISRRKYRTTVISLALSVVIFLASAGFTGILTELAGETASNYNYDFSIQGTPEQYAAIRELDFVEQSAMVWDEQCHGLITAGTYSEEYLEAIRTGQNNMDHPETPRVNVYFLEDEVFRSFAAEQGIDPEPYFSADTPQAICIRSKSNIYIGHADGTEERHVLSAQVFEEVPASMDLYSTQVPTELMDLIASFGGGWDFVCSTWEGHLVQTWRIFDGKIPAEYPTNADGSLSFVLLPRTLADGSSVIDFHFFSLDTQTVGELFLTEEKFPLLPSIEVRDQADELPFGVRSYSGTLILSVVLPASASFGDFSESLNVKTSDYEAMTDWLQANLEEYRYQDFLASQVQSRNVVTIVNVFAYGFIILISLICVCNVFNTISTNIALRRRDFGMLRSVGMQSRQLRAMLLLECARYGVKSLLFGLPIGLAIGYEIFVLLDLGAGLSYRFPWGAILAAVLGVFTVVFITMRYAVAKLRSDDPIAAIRMDNL